MKHCFFIFLSFLAILATANFLFAEDVPRTLRVLTFNIHTGIGEDDKYDLERTAKVITDLKPDLVALQEVDRNTVRTKKTDQPAKLAELTGMQGVFGKTIDFQGGEYGVAILSKFPIENHRMNLFPVQPKTENRGLLQAAVDIPGLGKTVFACTHFCHQNESRRIEQAKTINDLLTEDDSLAILCGDFNAPPESESIKILNEKWENAATGKTTFPGGDKQIDYVFYRPKNALKLKEVQVVEDKITSDHFPVIVVFEVAR